MKTVYENSAGRTVLQEPMRDPGRTIVPMGKDKVLLGCASSHALQRTHYGQITHPSNRQRMAGMPKHQASEACASILRIADETRHYTGSTLQDGGQCSVVAFPA